MKLEHYIQVGQKRLRCGYTTGTAAAAAARAAALLLVCQERCEHIIIETPAGISVTVETEGLERRGKWAVCGVRKDAGDDTDVTDGMLICARVRTIAEKEVRIDGGEGIGRVTRPGLDQSVGSAAINSAPRGMIEAAVRAVLEQCGADCGVEVIIFAPDGEKIAQKTFNPRIGIEGGISVLGTSGIVRPMSEEALKASIRAELSVLRSEGQRNLLLSPGNYGADFCREQLGLNLERAVQCSNYIGDTLDMAAAMGFRSVLLVGHAGKLVKCAAGVMNTHSRTADGRMEILTAHAALCGGSGQLLEELMQAVSVDSAVDLLSQAGLREAVMERVKRAAHGHLQRRAGSELRVEVVIFSRVYGLLGVSEGAEELIERYREEQGR